MCGIAGFYGDFNEQLLEQMSSIIEHRGPDGSGAFFDQENEIGLAHRRLAVIDLSPAGHQPMEDANHQAVISYNGEIYNFRELRDELIAKGYKFKGHSDTEVLLSMYLEDGIEMLTKLNGIFSFAIWDKMKKELFVARDGLGVKPFYYCEAEQGFLFGSELKSLLKWDKLPKDLNPLAIASYLTYLWSPGSETILKSVKKLEPGNALIVSNRKIIKKWCFYKLPIGSSKKFQAVQKVSSELRSSIDTAVKRQMVSDVPVGAFLSGGLDSSAIVAFAKQYSKERLKCFTIEFDSNANTAKEGMTDDLPYAEKVARHLDVDLHRIKVGPEIVNHLHELIYHLDEPQADPAPLNAMLISKLAKKSGITVLLSGAGGDDILSGYRRHYALSKQYLWDWLPSKILFLFSKWSQKLSTSHAIFRRIRKLFEYAYLRENNRIVSYFYWLNPSLSVSLLKPKFSQGLKGEDVTQPLLSTISDLPSDSSQLDKMLSVECKYFLADHNLNYTDKTSMAHGVEVRVPLLDRDLVEFAAKIPDRLKQNGSQSKWIFKKSMAGILPNDVIYRPKTGFGAPLRRWLNNELKPLVDDILSDASLQRRAIFDVSAVKQLIEADRTNKIDASYSIFAIVCIEIWCRIFIDESTAFFRR